jgi:hypothetical protein
MIQRGKDHLEATCVVTGVLSFVRSRKEHIESHAGVPPNK